MAKTGNHLLRYVRDTHDFDLSADLIAGQSIIHKFGSNADVGTTFEPIAEDGMYPTPQAASATTIRVKAGGNANDTAAGSGAREVTIQGLNELGELKSEAVATAGASASSATTTTFIRVFKAWVSASGTYATSAAGAHSASITLENGAGGTDWATIPFSGFAFSRTSIAAYSVPLGYTAYVLNLSATVQSNKTADILFFCRENILESAAPYSSMQLLKRWVGVNAQIDHVFDVPLKINALSDFGFMTKAATTAEVTADFDVVLIQDDFE